MDVTVCFGRNVVLLSTDGAHAFLLMMYLNNNYIIKAGQQAPNQYSHCDLTMTESCLIKQHILIHYLQNKIEQNRKPLFQHNKS